MPFSYFSKCVTVTNSPSKLFLFSICLLSSCSVKKRAKKRQWQKAQYEVALAPIIKLFIFVCDCEWTDFLFLARRVLSDWAPWGEKVGIILSDSFHSITSNVYDNFIPETIQTGSAHDKRRIDYFPPQSYWPRRIHNLEIGWLCLLLVFLFSSSNIVNRICRNSGKKFMDSSIFRKINTLVVECVYALFVYLHLCRGNNLFQWCSSIRLCRFPKHSVLSVRQSLWS